MKTGAAFSDYISTENLRRRNTDFGDKKPTRRDFILPLLLAFVFLLLFARLFYLQIIKGGSFRYLSENNRTKTVVIHAPRGIILDRSGKPLVFNSPGYRENIDGKTVFLSQDEALSLIAKGKKDLEIDSLRQYPYKEEFSHVLGYTGQISKEQLESGQFKDYGQSDVVGKIGLESQYEAKLRGIDGKQLYEVDAKGEMIRKLGQQDPVPGENITTTLDLKLQNAAFSAMKDVKKGALIVTKPKGEILTLISKPSFDPNLFTMGQNYKVASDSSYLKLPDILLDGQSQPLLDRTISGTYPPGSTFKLIVAASGLENKIIDANWQIEDTGVLKVGDFSFSNWYFTGYGGKDGEVNVVKGIKRSNDIFFYKLAEKVGVDTVSKTAFSFNLGKTLGIDLPGETTGTVPTREWKLKNIGEQWYLGDTYHYGIGQGFLLTTPLQVNGWTEALSNGGNLFQPHLLKSERPNSIAQNLLDPSSFSLIREGMIQACSPGGVAWPFFNFTVKNPKLKVDGKNILAVNPASGSADLPAGRQGMRQVVVACKTGTAEHGNETQAPHAWITLFAPAYNPQIVVTVLAESSGEGSNIAAPIAKKVLQEWFSR